MRFCLILCALCDIEIVCVDALGDDDDEDPHHLHLQQSQFSILFQCRYNLSEIDKLKNDELLHSDNISRFIRVGSMSIAHPVYKNVSILPTFGLFMRGSNNIGVEIGGDTMLFKPFNCPQHAALH